MSQKQTLNLELKGLYTAPNQLSGVPQGALSIADNVVLNAKNLVDSRRGQTQYGSVLTIGAGQINKLFNYKSSLIVNYANKMAYDSNGAGLWVDYTGTYLSPASNMKMRSLESNSNFYFTTSTGIKKISTLTENPVAAGVVRALAGTATLTGGSGFLEDDSAVAYRIVWGYRDANNNLILGAPSQRIIVSNSSGSSKDVELTFIIPDTITTDYFYQIYRNASGTATATDEPTDELQLALEYSPTAGEIIAKSITIVDSTPYSLLRATLYTSPSQEGIENSNFQPPLAMDMDVFKNCAFYANVKQKQTLPLTLISVDSPSFGYVTLTGDTTSASAIVTSVTTTNLRVGMRVIGTGIQTDSRILSIDSPTQITMTKTATATNVGTSLEFQDRLTVASVDYWGGSTQDVATNTFMVATLGTPGVNIDDTATNLVEIVNKSALNTTVYAYYLSALDDLPGQLQFEERSLGGGTFTATSTSGDSFSPEITTGGITSTNETNQNRVFVSKTNQPEAVPLYRFFNVGSANFPIQRVVALRDGIFFFKQDGVYRLTGETFENFIVTLLDNTVVLQVPESAVAFNNQIFCFTTQAIVAVSDSGIQIMSVPIETELLELSSEQFTYFSTASFGVAYESARLYMFFTVSTETDQFATQAFVYNSLTDSWTRWIMNRTCGVVNPAVNKLFMGETDSGQVFIERKSYTDLDYADEQYPVTISSVTSDSELVLASATNVFAGQSIRQGSTYALILNVVGTTLTIPPTVGFVAGSAAVYNPILNRVLWAPVDMENPGMFKQFCETTFFFKNATFTTIEASFATNASTGLQAVDLINTAGAGWGEFPWGEAPWGGKTAGETVLRTYVPKEKQRGNWMKLQLQTEEAFSGFSLQGVSINYRPMSTRIR